MIVSRQILLRQMRQSTRLCDRLPNVLTHNMSTQQLHEEKKWNIETVERALAVYLSTKRYNKAFEGMDGL